MVLHRHHWLFSIVMCFALLAPPTVSSAANASCQGRAATLVGSARSETLNGTAFGDVIVAKGGGDTIRGRGGNDVICAGDGADTVYGGGGADKINGDAGRDKINGDAGRDNINGGAGRDKIKGAAGNDRLRGGTGIDNCLGGGGTNSFLSCETPKYTLTVTPAGSGSGLVTSSPVGIDCGATCSTKYPIGKMVQLGAAPAAGSSFIGWGGACSGTGTCTVAMTAARSVTATFTEGPTIVDARVIADAGLQDRFDSGDVVRLTFDEDMHEGLATNGVFELTDGDGDTFNLSCDATAACVLSDNGADVDRLLTLTVNAMIADTNAPGDGLREIPATITTTNAAVTDEPGTIVDLPASSDVTVDKEAA